MKSTNIIWIFAQKLKKKKISIFFQIHFFKNGPKLEPTVFSLKIQIKSELNFWPKIPLGLFWTQDFCLFLSWRQLQVFFLDLLADYLASKKEGEKQDHQTAEKKIV